MDLASLDVNLALLCDDGFRSRPLPARIGLRARTGRGRSWSNVVAVLILACFYLTNVVQPEITLPHFSIQKWAENVGQKIYSISARATALTDIQTDYLLMYAEVRPQNGSVLVQELKDRLEELFSRKVQAVNRLVKVAEKSYSDHVYNDKIQISYWKAKNLTSNYTLMTDNHFYGVEVNLTSSSIHVPTNVYDGSIAVLNGVSWSAALDETFQENYKTDPTLSWQYFGSSTGFFRNYPGIRWPKPEDEVDLYDCRTRGWYIQAATSPKDMVILLDSSGSMKGLRMEIAKATVRKIVETLSDDDFFNVIKFSETPEYLEPCFNGTMVQATINNRKIVFDRLNKGIKTHNIAYFDKALTEAFDLLNSMNSSEQGSQCNKAIMIITDGAPDTYESIFKQYNWPNKDVRVFTYLIGREVGDPRHVRWMACSNKGFYSHISTLADVHEHVQEYIHVISRPMVILRANQTVWTNIYRDTSHSEEGVHMTISVAQPVYNIKNGTANSGDLLGVMGTDVPLKELISQIPHHKLGVNGYAFAITNNGYVLFHPDLRPLHNGEEKPKYNSVDLSEVELMDSPTIQWRDETSYKREMELRTLMIDRKTGSLQMRTKLHFDDMKRATTRVYNYFFTAVDNTPFSLGIALPDGYGSYWVDGTRSLRQADLSDFRSELSITLADWEYCRPQSSNDSNLQPYAFLIKSLERGKEDPEYFKKYCDVDLVNSLLFDAEATRGVTNNWRKENTDGTINDSTSKKNGVELVFIATKGGLTRYLALVDNLTDPDFIRMNNDTIRELYYSRAVEGGEGVFTFSVPLLEDKNQADVNSTVVTASTPVFISSVNSAGVDAMSVAAVTGLQMKYSKFHEFVLGATSVCVNPDGSSCNITCDNEMIDCYLLDNNGFVVFSEYPEQHLGRFFGEIDGPLMARLVKDDNQTSNQTDGIFTKIEIIDYQGMCNIWRKAHCSARSMFVDPVKNLLLALWWLLQRAIMFIFSFSDFVLYADDMTVTTGNASFYGDPGDYDSYNPGSSRDVFTPNLAELYEIAGNNSDLVREWLNEWRALQMNGESGDVVYRWYQNILDKYAPQIIGLKPCTNLMTAYEAQPNIVHDTLTKHRSCGGKSFSVVPVYRTNLLLLVVESTGTCESGDGKMTLQPVELDPSPMDKRACPIADAAERNSCQKLQTDVYRKRPLHCYASHKQENSTRCGGISHVSPPSVFMLSVLLVFSTSLAARLRL